MNLTHISQDGDATMVDITDKPSTERMAKASCSIKMKKATLELIMSGGHKKGDVIAVARIAGIQAAKKTWDLIPLCHPLSLSSIKLDFDFDSKLPGVNIYSTCKLTGQTGVEMEALTAVSVAALTLYDMCKAVDKGIMIKDIRLNEKTGGKSGHWQSEATEGE